MMQWKNEHNSHYFALSSCTGLLHFIWDWIELDWNGIP